jgi:small subunit ribosomal protein S21
MSKTMKLKTIRNNERYNVYKKVVPFDTMLKRWKNKVEEDGVLIIYREKEFFEKRSAKRKRKMAAAKSRQKRITADEKNYLKGNRKY